MPFTYQVEEFGIIHFLQTIYESHRILVPLIEEHGGILLKLEGDSMPVIFRNVAEAIDASIDMQRTCGFEVIDYVPPGASAAFKLDYRL